jgi:hypothetical protein
LSALAAEIQRTTLDRNEAEIAASVAERIGRSPLDDESRRALAPFVEWCNARQVRYCAAKPATVAAFVFHQKRIGGADGVVLATLDAVTRLHDAYQLANPVATHAVRSALAQTMTIEPPRSWPADDKAAFARLPADVAAVIARRERERDSWFRRQQNAAVECNKEATVGGVGPGPSPPTNVRTA